MWPDNFYRVYRLRRDVARWVKMAAIMLTHWRGEIVKYVPIVFWWMHAAPISLLWISFEGYAFAWSKARPHLSKILGVSVSGWPRLIFCLLLSIVVGHLIVLMYTPFRPSIWTLFFWTVHALVIHTFWNTGARWCNRQLGVRPSRYVDPKRPYAGLDLGN